MSLQDLSLRDLARFDVAALFDGLALRREDHADEAHKLGHEDAELILTRAAEILREWAREEREAVTRGVSARDASGAFKGGRMSARAIDLLRAAWAEEGRLDAAERASRRRERVRSTRTTDDTRDTRHERRTQVLAVWLQDHSIYGTGEQ